MAKTAFLLAATQSNSGKTTIAMGLMKAFCNMGLNVQPFKVGPDYIDPMYHTAATGRNSRNLDSFMLEEDTIRYLFEKNSNDADLSIVEGVMGLYDGQGGFSLKGSSAHIAQLLDLPVILVVNGNGMSLSVAALIKGFQDFSPETKIGGVILNQVKNDSGFIHLKEIIETNCKIPVYGYLPKNPQFALNDRHLGLYCSEEINDLDEKFERIAEALTEHCDLNRLREDMARVPHDASAPPLPSKIHGSVTIGYARDSAFNFYYRDSLDLLEELGATLIPFSPMKDKSLPPMDGVILGGGYPELYLEELSANKSFLRDLKEKLEQGLPCFAECGGLIYLGKTMTIHDKTHELTGFFPFDFTMTDRLQHFGYMEASIEAGTPLTTEGELSIRGHEFHYTKRIDTTDYPTSYRVTKKRRTKDVHWEEGYRKQNVLGGYPHFNFYSNPQCAKNLLLMAKAYHKERLDQK